MCGVGGIVGTIHPDKVDSALARMIVAMKHRGPDDDGRRVGVSGGTAYGLCATRLAIQDCRPAGHQPMVSERTGHVLGLNGEVYNVGDLRQELIRRGYSFKSRADTEVALAAFDEWGIAFVERLIGMFAMCVWDAQECEILLIRDRVGIKPLYYFEGSGMILFASEIRALLRTGLLPRRLSHSGIASYLRLGAVREPDTIIDGIRVLPPGHLATSRGGALNVQEYWSLAESFATKTRATTRADAVAKVRQQLEAATRRHLISDVPLGVFLSGGIDSSALVGLVSQVGTEVPKTISVVFPEKKFSEERYMRMIVDRFHTDHVEVRLAGSDFLRDLPAALEAMDQPTFDGVNTYVVSKAARERGLTVVLSGLGGDELFAGYDSFRNVPRLDALRARIPSPFASLAGRAIGIFFGNSDRRRKLSRWLCDRDAVSAYELQRELFSPAACAELFPSSPPMSPSAAARLHDPINSVSLLELEVYMRNVLLRDSDVMSMAHSLELRVPFLDHELVEFITALPGSWKMNGSDVKPLLVDAVADLLPRAVYDRDKMGFTFPFEHWMRGALREEIEDVLLENGPGCPLQPLLDGHVVQGVWTAFLDQQSHFTRAWSLYVLKVWCERNLAPESAPDT